MYDDQKIQDIKFDKLKRKLRELFQMDKADLDFGIYRIMNQKRAELDVFIDNDLRSIAQDELKKYDTGKTTNLQEELDRAIESARELGVDPETVEKVKLLREQMKAQVSSGDVEGEVYSHLTDFFGRYYDGGDFISQRRYKDGVYAIPYQGEEVKLYWANHDQYYIKTSENFKNFSFLLANGKKVTFTIVEAETEKDNNKASSDKERRFILIKTEFLEVRDDELLIKFEYKPSKEKQDKLTKDAVQRISNSDLADDFSGVLDKAPTEKNASRTVLEKWLTHYTSKNTFDYFIHKDLRGFLSQELDFYIKNEMLRIDDLDALNEEVNTRNISKIKAFKHIAKQIINFLSQLEDFQKLLWEKKKFVVQSDYIFTLDQIDEKYFESILSNEEQISEWKNLGFIDDSTKLDFEYLKNHQTLQLDTQFFPDIKYDLIHEDIDGKITGLMLNSDNFGALGTLANRYENQIKCVYIDPPYNTDSSEIIYKNGYKHSSWLSLIHNRAARAIPLMTKDGIFEFAIDNEEQARAELALSSVFGADNLISKIAILQNPKGRDKEHFADSHEYMIVYAKNKKFAVTSDFIHTDGELTKKYPNYDGVNHYRYLPLKRTGSESKRSDRPYMFFPILAKRSADEVFLSMPSKEDIEPLFDKNNGFNDAYLKELLDRLIGQGYECILPKSEGGEYLRWRWGYDSIVEGIKTGYVVGLSNRNESVTVFQKDILDDKYKPKTFWIGEKYDASSKGTNYLKNLFPLNNFDYPKSIYAMEDSVFVGTQDDSTVLDFFAGSGTTGDAVIKLNRKYEGSNRKFILVEMGSYFDTITKPRIQKVTYSDNWKSGKPLDQGETGSSQVIKYIKLESYEDALNNIKLAPRTNAQELLLGDDDKLRRDYTLNYMLNFESEGSNSLVNIEKFEDPFNYTLEITGDNNEIKTEKIDLVDTFNYLIGLKVERIEQAHGFVVVEGSIAQSGEKTLVIWRNTKEKSNSDLNDFLEKSAYNPADNEFSIIYVNGDNNVENLQTGDENYKVRLIEEEFFKQMFS